MIPDKDLTDDVLDEIIAGAKTSMEQYLALSLKAEREAWRQAGNSPVIPDGYVMVPKEPTPEILAVITEAIKSMRGSAATYARVLAAAPQEVSDGK